MMMKEKVGEVFSIAMDNPAIPGCTISKAVHDGANDIICFSLARNTDISAEIYPYHKLIIMAEGVIEIYGADGFRRNLHTSESIITLTDTPMGIRTAEGAVYTEVSIRRSDIMNEAIKAGEVFRLAEIVPYQDGKIVNMDVVHNDKMKFVIMAFDAGTECQRPADCVQYRMVRAESSHCASRPVVSGRQEYPSGSDAPRLPLSQCGEGAGGELRHRRYRHGGRRPKASCR